MSTFISKRKFGKKGKWAVAAAVVTAAFASASLAVATPDDGPADGGAPIATTCGANLSSTVITRNSPSTMSMVAFQQLPGAIVTPAIDDHLVVPDGESRCIKVLFTAETACGGDPAANDFCYVRALVDGVTPMDPDGINFQAIDSEDGTASAHAYEWVTKVGEGAHNIRIEWRVGAATTQFYTDDWTMDVQTAAV